MAIADLDSITARLISQDADGALHRTFFTRITANTTAATTTSGAITIQRFPASFTVPSVNSPYTGWEMEIEMLTEDVGSVIAGLEYNLGSLAVSTNVFTSGVSMPTKTTRVLGTTYASQQTAAMMPMLVCDAALTATTPTITITYTNEDGTGSRTASLTLPTSPAINTVFDMSPHLDTNDTGLISVSNMSKSAGTAGTLSVRGVLPINFMAIPVAGGISACKHNQVLQQNAKFLCEAGDVIAFYNYTNLGTKDLHVNIFGRPI